jgi:hypothetical protein
VVKVVKCLKCHCKWEIPIDAAKPEKCKYCRETHFLNIYESLSPEEVKAREAAKLIIQENILKGGDEMAKKKEEKEAKPAKEAKEKKQSITDVRVENAKKLVDFVKSLTNDSKEYTKIMSRAFSIIKKK